MRTIILAAMLAPAIGGCGRGGAGGAPAHLQPGYWDQVVTVIEPREDAGKTMRRGRCLSPAQAARPASLFEAAARENRCTLSGFTMAGGRISGRSACEMKAAGTRADFSSTMEGRYSETEMDVTVRGRSVLDNGEQLTMVTHSVGHRVRDCREGDPQR